MTEPRFKIGDFVMLKAQQEYRRLFPGDKIEQAFRRGKPWLLHVLTIHQETCPGGTQFHYICRPATNDSYAAIERFNESELEPAPTEPAPVSQEA